MRTLDKELVVLGCALAAGTAAFGQLREHQVDLERTLEAARVAARQHREELAEQARELLAVRALAGTLADLLEGEHTEVQYEQGFRVPCEPLTNCDICRAIQKARTDLQ